MPGRRPDPEPGGGTIDSELCEVVDLPDDVRAAYDLDAFYMRTALDRGVPIISSDSRPIVDYASASAAVQQTPPDEKIYFIMMGADEKTHRSACTSTRTRRTSERPAAPRAHRGCAPCTANVPRLLLLRIVSGRCALRERLRLSCAYRLGVLARKCARGHASAGPRLALRERGIKSGREARQPCNR